MSKITHKTCVARILSNASCYNGDLVTWPDLDDAATVMQVILGTMLFIFVCPTLVEKLGNIDYQITIDLQITIKRSYSNVSSDVFSININPIVPEVNWKQKLLYPKHLSAILCNGVILATSSAHQLRGACSTGVQQLSSWSSRNSTHLSLWSHPPKEEVRSLSDGWCFCSCL